MLTTIKRLTSNLAHTKKSKIQSNQTLKKKKKGKSVKNIKLKEPKALAHGYR